MRNLTIDKNHIYRVDGRTVPGVTSILKALNFVNYDGPHFTEEKRKRGEILHKCVALMLEKDLDWDTVSPSLASEVSSVSVWVEESGFVPLLIEKSLYSSIYSYAGTIDAFGAFPDGSYGLPDWKRGKAFPAAKYQLALYSQLVCENSEELLGVKVYPHQINRFALDGIGSGRPKPVPYKNKNDRDIALGLVAAFHAGVNDGIFSLEA